MKREIFYRYVSYGEQFDPKIDRFSIYDNYFILFFFIFIVIINFIIIIILLLYTHTNANFFRIFER